MIMIPRRSFHRATSLDAQVQQQHEGEDDGNHSVHAYKHIMEGIKRENPDLSVMAQQKLALERCAKLQQGNDVPKQVEHNKRFSWDGVLKTFHIGQRQKDDSKHEGWVDGVDISDSMGSTHQYLSQDSSSSTDISSSCHSRTQRSIALQQSVALSGLDLTALEELNLDNSYNENSLADSLNKIEIAAGCPEEPIVALEKSLDRRSRRSMQCSSIRFSRRLSGISIDSGVSMDQMDLFDLGEVDEEEELSASSDREDETNGEEKEKAAGKDTRQDMVVDALLNFSFDTNQEPVNVPVNFGAGIKNGKETAVPVNSTPRRKERRANRYLKKSQLSHGPNASDECNHASASSFVSVDPYDYNGDFSAWRSSFSSSSAAS